MKRIIMIVALGVMAGAYGWAQQNGTWTATEVDAASWSDGANWLGGASAGGGGVATLNLGRGITIANDLPGPLSLSRLQVNFADASGDYTASISGGTNLFGIVSVQSSDKRGRLSLGNTVLDGGDITFQGSSRVLLGFSTNLYTGRTIVTTNAALLVKADEALGPVPLSRRADDIILDGGTLMNDEHNIFLSTHENRGITIPAGSRGYLGASHNNAATQINGPITGAGSLGINFQNSPVILTSPDNGYAGDTVIGTTNLGADTYFARLRLGADEVIPHGDGKGNLVFAWTEGYNSPMLDLNGFNETVNGLVSTNRAIITTSVPGQGRLTVLSDFMFDGKLEFGVTLRGAGNMSLLGAQVSGGTIEVPAGTQLPFSGAMFYPDGTLAFDGGGAVLTNLPGFYEFTGPAEGNWPGNLARTLAFSGFKPTAEWVAYPIGGFALNTQYCYKARWHVPSDSTYSFAGSFDDGFYLAIDGVEILSLMSYNQRRTRQGVFLQAGWHDVELRCYNGASNGGRPSGWPSGIIFSPDNLDFEDNGNLALGQAFGAAGDTVAAMGDANYIFGRMLMNESGTITVPTDPRAPGDPVFSGTVQSMPGKTLTFSGLTGPLLFGAPAQALYPAVLDGDVSNTLILTNNVWLRRLPTPFTVAPDATLAFDGIACPDASSGNLSLNTYSLRMLESTPGISSVTVNTGRTLTFDSRTYAGGAFTDSPTAFTTDFTLSGGTTLFNARQPMQFSGSFNGAGTITKNGAGTLTLAGNGSGCAATFSLNEGALALSGAGALCDAPVHLAGGTLVSLTSMTLNNPITAQTGGIETPAGTILETTGVITGTGAISKWGDGTLRLSGGADNANLQLDLRGGTAELNKSGGYAVRSIGVVQPGATVKLTGASGNQIADDGRVQLSGGTFDLNGNSETVASIANTTRGSVIINDGNQPATLTLAGTENAVFENGMLCDGASTLALTKTGSGTQTLDTDALWYSGATTVDGGTLTLLANGCNKSALFRLTFLAPRTPPPDAPTGAPNHWHSGIQFSEFQLTYKGNGLSWPALSEMDVQGIGGSNAEVASSAVDNSTDTKWYFSDGTPLPNALTISCPASIEFDGYRLATANDAQGRDPAAWTFEIGVVDGTTTNWITLDTQADFDMPANRRTYCPILPVEVISETIIPDVVPLSARQLAVNAGGTLKLRGFTWGQPLGGLTGAGTVELDDSDIILPNPGNFTGAITGNGTVTFTGATGQISIIPLGAGVTFINNGVPATLMNTNGVTQTWGGNIQDGLAPIGITQTAGTTYYSGQDSTYTGDTLLSGGEAIVAHGLARYVRFTPLVMRPGGENGSGYSYQICRFRLMRDGQELAYPEGTTVYGEVSNGGGVEVVGNLILPDPPTGKSKFYHNDANRINPIVIELPEEIFIDGYTWYTADDSTGRDPVTWTVELSIDKVAWIEVDRRTDETGITEDRYTKAGEWLFNNMVSGEYRAFSPNSAMTIGDGARLSVLNASEPVGPLFGEGGITLGNGTLILCTFADADFEGAVSGNGTLIKQGAATQTFSGTLGFNGNLIVEGGTLNLDDAALAGVTNIVLRGGVLTGSATVGGDLAITCEGGTYNATLNITGTLTILGDLLLAAPEIPYRKTLFTYTYADPATLTALTTAQMTTPLPPGINVTVRTTPTTATLTVSRTGTILMLR